MSVNPDESELTSVYARITGGPDNAEDAVPDSASIDLVLELEAGSTIFGLAPKYNLSVVLNDLSDSSNTIYASVQAGSQQDANWPAAETKFAFTIPANTVLTPARDGHVLQATAVMSVGVNDPQVEVQQSELFIVTHP